MFSLPEARLLIVQVPGFGCGVGVLATVWAGGGVGVPGRALITSQVVLLKDHRERRPGQGDTPPRASVSDERIGLRHSLTRRLGNESEAVSYHWPPRRACPDRVSGPASARAKTMAMGWARALSSGPVTATGQQ
jgi:hypothetical protein